MTKENIILILITMLLALTIMQKLEIFYLKERIKNIENFINNVAEEIKKEIDKDGKE